MSTLNRQGDRYCLDGRVNIAVYRGAEKFNLWGRISDLSESGMGATVSGQLSQGEFVVLQFSVLAATASRSLELRARVCHQRGYYCGFEFLIVSDQQREHIKLACQALPIKYSQANPKTS